MRRVLLPFLIVILILSVKTSRAQSVGVKFNQPVSGDAQVLSLLVEWLPLGSSNIACGQLATTIHNKYKDKLLSVAASANPYGLIFNFRHGVLDEENILQIVKLEGVQTPYFRKGNFRFSLNGEGRLIQEEIK